MKNENLFNIAKTASAKGFKPNTLTTKVTNDYLLGGKNLLVNDTCIYLWMCEVQMWLREKHNINVLIAFETIDDSETAYTWHINYYIEEGKDRKKDTWDFYENIYSFSQERMQWFDTYEQALESGLLEGLKLI